MKWTRLADLPAPMWDMYVAVQDSKVYVAGGGSPVDEAYDQTFVYDVNTDCWNQLPPSGHYFGIPSIVGGNLVIIGGVLCATDEYTNKVSTFNETSQIWTSYYPNLLQVRCRPGVIAHLEHVIAAGGEVDSATQGEIEVLNWIENSSWRKSSITLPVPMWNFTPTIAYDQLFIVSYFSGYREYSRKAFVIPVADITGLDDKQQTPTKWETMNSITHLYTAPIPNLSPPVVIGGRDADGVPTADIIMHDASNKSWRKISSLSSARSEVAVAAINNNAIIVIRGCTRGDTNAKSSSLPIVELGQAAITKSTIVTF